MPANKNLKAKGLKHWIRARKRDNEVLANCLGYGGPDCPTASGRRRVTLSVARKTAKSLPDEQNLEEGLYDALKTCRFIVDDSAKWLERVPTIVHVDRTLEYPVVSTVTVEDL